MTNDQFRCCMRLGDKTTLSGCVEFYIEADMPGGDAPLVGRAILISASR